MKNYAAAYSLLANYRPGGMAPYSTAHAKISLKSTPTIQGAITSATSIKEQKGDYSQHPCRLIRIMGFGENNLVNSASAPAVSSDGPKNDYSQHPCRLLRIMGSRNTSKPTIDASHLLTNSSSVMAYTHLDNGAVLSSESHISFASTPQHAPETHSVHSANDLNSLKDVLQTATNASTGSLPVRIPIVAPIPRSTASFLYHGKYASYGDIASWRAMLIGYPDEMVRSSNTYSTAGHAIPWPECEQSNECALVRTSLLKSGLQVGPAVNQSYYPPVSASVASQSLWSSTQDYSSSTSAYNLYFCEPARKSGKNGSDSGGPSKEKVTRKSIVPMHKVGSDVTAGNISPLNTPSLKSPRTDNSSSSFESSTTLVSTSLTNTEDLKEYTALMISRILTVRDYPDVLSAKWLLAIEEEYRACQEVMASEYAIDVA